MEPKELWEIEEAEQRELDRRKLQKNKRRININIWGDVTEEEAVNRVAHVIGKGRVSNNGETYCFATRFNDSLVVVADKTYNGHDTFTVYDEKELYGEAKGLIK